MEQDSARLTLLTASRKKAMLETLCAKEDVTSSQQVRQTIRDVIDEKTARVRLDPGQE